MKKTAIICSETAKLKKSIEILSEILLDYTLEYPICTDTVTDDINASFRKIYIGTADCTFIKKADLKIPPEQEGYRIKVCDDTVFIGGRDCNGVLYGCMDFYNKYILKYEFPHEPNIYRINIFNDILPEFEYSSYPCVKHRGLWTWGHVIYDYKGYFDNMVKLKMNTVVIWNDFAPVNAAEMVEYAHSCGIKVFWGYSWGWDTDCLKFSQSAKKYSSREILDKYEKEYAALGGDGIYFQSYTELSTQEINGINIAESVTEYVNDTADLFFDKYPSLELQFGLHAMSVNKNLDYIKNINKKIRIVWENCGSFPFSYIPSDTADFDNTLNFSKTIAALRGKDDKFGIVTKGFTKLDWSAFTHQAAPSCSGVSSSFMKRNRIERKRKIWKYLQAYWLTNADKALTLIKTLSDIKNRNLYVTPLVEDGMFEENIMFPVALFSEMLWDCNTPLSCLINEVALRDYVVFA